MTGEISKTKAHKNIFIKNQLIYQLQNFHPLTNLHLWSCGCKDCDSPYLPLYSCKKCCIKCGYWGRNNVCSYMDHLIHN